MQWSGSFKIGVWAVLWACFAGQGWAAVAPERVDAILLDMLGAVSAVQAYEAHFVVRTRNNGEMSRPHTLFIKQRRKPRCTYMRWVTGPKANQERVFCSDEESAETPVRRRARTLMNRKELMPAQLQALQVVLRPTQEDGLYGMVARYANQYFDAAQNARPDEFIVEVRDASVFDRAADCLQLRRRDPKPGAPFAGQTEICVDKRSKLPTAFRFWDPQGRLLESYLIGDYKINPGLTDADFELDRGQSG